MPFNVTAKDLAFGSKSPSGNYPLLAMLHAYLDESEYQGPICVVAGFVGSDNQWEALGNDWKKALSPKKHLHVSQLRWNPRYFPRNTKLLDRLGPIPYLHGLTPLAGIISLETWKSASLRNETIGTFDLWLLAFRKIFLGLSQWLPENETVSIHFENHGKFAPIIHQMWESVKRSGMADNRFVNFGFIEKNVCSFLEPADFLASQLKEYLRDPKSGRAACGLSIMKDGENCYGGQWSVDELLSHSRHVATELLISLNQGRHPVERKK